MAKNKRNKKNKGKLKAKLTKKFRLVVLNEASFEERFSFKLTRLNVFVWGGVFSILLISLTVLLIAFTPIKEYIPGYDSSKLKKNATTSFYKVDSLQSKIKTIEKYIQVLQPILKGKDTTIQLLNAPQISEEELLIAASLDKDSIQQIVNKMQKELDSTWKAYYEQEKIGLENKFQKDKEEFHLKTIDTIQKVAESYELQLNEKSDLLKKMETELSLKDKNISFLENKIASKNNNLSASENRQSSQRIRQEIKDLLDKEYREKEAVLKESFALEFNMIKDSLLLKQQVIDSFSLAMTNNQEKKIGEIRQEQLVKDIHPEDAKLLTRSKKDSIFRENVEREDRFSLFDFETNKVDVVFFAPVRGIVTENYNVKEKHYAVDIAVAKGSAVKSIAKGTVIFAEWTAETGYVLIVEHSNKYISVYKHNEIIYRNQGDLVQSGEVIAMAGSSGEYSTGTHLHFEMWFEGYPINPTNFIEFE